MPGYNLLSDIRIVDLSTVIFGPYCTQTLADLGADVIKIEPKSGDTYRNVGRYVNTRHMGPCHMVINRGKRSVDWDLKSDEGQAALHALIKTSDVLIMNIRGDAAERIGITFDKLKEIKPDIVFVHCTGFGSDGPYAGKPAYDDLIQALSGLTSLLPRVDGNERPRFLPMAVADKVSGMHAVYATLAALHHRDKTGEPVYAEVPMLESVTHFLMIEHFFEAAFDPPRGSYGYDRQLDPTRQPLQTKDGYIVIAPYIDARWVKMFEAMDRADILDDEQLNDQRKRFFNVGYMMERVQEVMLTNTTEHWLKVLSDADIPAARANQLEDLMDDPHLKATGFFQRRDHPTEGGYWEPQPPVKFHGQEKREIMPARYIGEDTEAVLQELGLGVSGES